MKEEDANNDTVFSSEVAQFFKHRAEQEEFKTPPEYFNDAENRIWAGLSDNLQDDDFFEEQKRQIQAAVHLSNFKMDETIFEVPKNYFESREKDIQRSIAQLENRSRVVRFNKVIITALATAACILLGVFLYHSGEKKNSDVFASTLDKADLDIEDLEYFADEEGYYDLFLTEINMDTTVIDTTTMQISKEIKSNKLDPRTGLPLREDGHSSEEKPLPRWEDLTDEDLLEYLMNESEEEVIDEMN